MINSYTACRKFKKHATRYSFISLTTFDKNVRNYFTAAY